MRALFILAFAASLLLLAVSYSVLPDKVALHFGSGGTADNWGSKEAYVAIFFVSNLFSFTLFWCIPYLTRFTPDSLLSLPKKEFWLQKENRPEMERRLHSYFSEFGAALLIFMSWVEVLCLRAHFEEPVRLNESAMLVGLAIFFVYVMYFCVKPLWLFRPPKEQH
jgi:uncharacterized membrane protein